MRREPPCLAQHLCSALLGRLRRAPAKVPITTPSQPVTPSLIQPAEILHFVDSQAICSPKDQLKWEGIEAKREPFAFWLWEQAFPNWVRSSLPSCHSLSVTSVNRGMGTDGDVNSYCSPVQNLNKIGKFVLIMAQHTGLCWCGNYGGHGDAWHYRFCMLGDQTGPKASGSLRKTALWPT